MDVVVVSPKYQVVIPLKVREKMQVKPGQKMHVIAYDNMVVFIPAGVFQHLCAEAHASLYPTLQT